ncbi:MAG: abortive infection family protein [Defluviitaleaceae bacterium]|nr:abortive infection family protein [Defluviitaleaceae bacterium]
MTVFENVIEIHSRKLNDKLNDEFEFLYKDVNHDRLRVIFSTLHAESIRLFDIMNRRLPTDDDVGHYWADPSRDLIEIIESISQLKKDLMNSQLTFDIEPYYAELFRFCLNFLKMSGGSFIPPNTEKINLYYALPIFLVCNKKVGIDTPQIKTITNEYIRNLTERAGKDINEKAYDSAITKCRTLLEEVFCHVIELKNEQPSDKGNINALYQQVKKLYNMHSDSSMDVRVLKLLSGLEKIISAVAEMRNKASDSHGLGSKRVNIDDYHARLFVNASAVMSEFILAVAGRSKSTPDSIQS